MITVELNYRIVKNPNKDNEYGIQHGTSVVENDKDIFPIEWGYVDNFGTYKEVRECYDKMSLSHEWTANFVISYEDLE